ncbi:MULTISPECIES: hypothetical protein [unclassified Saccharopolyspora]|uniref:hypothetical protein n=1 Tax=unclassified Saccharopolyspora TaxID=2646250 RepID=UPI001CD7D243|nr:MULTISPECIES: hypothetical protein [unclassified Saccharopolyspora]MCA1189345.1 hypothetical protein [Saccharopolyspora sp. 6T]MCA1192977.1 hypothetical protein [Saccharopolyspora sp. 6V]MCA1226805.1 hypothetical protein [Saccharopolyspora sp. 6M]MCA1282600.1 hypothetical protein [Saccharopolyspora sp. 7B]
MVWKVIGGLLLLWLVVSVAGIVLKGLFWLAVLGGVLFVATAVIGYASDRKKLGETKRLGSK